MQQPRAIDETLLQDLVNRIVAAVHPRRIVLFGSAARGQMGPHSDVDLLVVMPDGAHRGDTTETIIHSMYGFRTATDVVVVTESDVQNYGTNPSLVIFPALREGKDIYRAAG
jgi:predicted nucleotidyltransferase